MDFRPDLFIVKQLFRALRRLSKYLTYPRLPNSILIYLYRPCVTLFKKKIDFPHFLRRHAPQQPVQLLDSAQREPADADANPDPGAAPRLDHVPHRPAARVDPQLVDHVARTGVLCRHDRPRGAGARVHADHERPRQRRRQDRLDVLPARRGQERRLAEDHRQLAQALRRHESQDDGRQKEAVLLGSVPERNSHVRRAELDVIPVGQNRAPRTHRHLHQPGAHPARAGRHRYRRRANFAERQEH